MSGRQPRRRVRGPWAGPPVEVLRPEIRPVRPGRRLTTIDVDRYTYRAFDAAFAEWYRKQKRRFREPASAQAAFIHQYLKDHMRRVSAIERIAVLEARGEGLEKGPKGEHRKLLRGFAGEQPLFFDVFERRTYGLAFSAEHARIQERTEGSRPGRRRRGGKPAL